MTTCATCHPGPTGAPACAALQADLRAMLAELRHQLPLLRASLPPGATPQTGSTTGGRATAPLPVRLDVLSLLGPGAPGTVRDHHGDQSGPPPVTAVLRDWAATVAQEQGKQLQLRRPPGTGAAEAFTEYLAERVPWISHREWAAELAGELRVILRQVRGITRSEPRTRTLTAPCVCGAFGLAERDWSDIVICAVCDRRMTPEEYALHAAAVLPLLYRIGVLIVATGASATEKS